MIKLYSLTISLFFTFRLEHKMSEISETKVVQADADSSSIRSRPRRTRSGCIRSWSPLCSKPRSYRRTPASATVRRLDSHGSDVSDSSANDSFLSMPDTPAQKPNEKKEPVKPFRTERKMSEDSQRHFRDHDRMLMRQWLETKADSDEIPGLRWLDKDAGLLQIAWRHGSRAEWTREDVEVFEHWAKYTGDKNRYLLLKMLFLAFEKF